MSTQNVEPLTSDCRFWSFSKNTEAHTVFLPVIWLAPWVAAVWVWTTDWECDVWSCINRIEPSFGSLLLWWTRGGFWSGLITKHKSAIFLCCDVNRVPAQKCVKPNSKHKSCKEWVKLCDFLIGRSWTSLTCSDSTLISFTLFGSLSLFGLLASPSARVAKPHHSPLWCGYEGWQFACSGSGELSLLPNKGSCLRMNTLVPLTLKKAFTTSNVLDFGSVMGCLLSFYASTNKLTKRFFFILF